MRGIIFALLGGAFITLQGVANSKISQDIGTWQTATITQFTGFLVAFIILMFARERKWQGLKKVKPLYLIGGTFGAIVVFGNVTAIHFIGVTLTVSAMLISQLGMTVLIDRNGWFGVMKQKMKVPQLIGIAMMIAGVVVLGL
ncbi:DMT family transporter [Bacillus sp. JJ1609]|uniref:DMT family transporter n=1 Tax=Bacillus sp. JJ1609 TaxID=3122977 RepID=UPI003000BF26